MASLGRKITFGAAWAAVESWARQVLMFVVFAILARLLGPEAYGLIALAMALPIILTVPVTRGIPDALVQRDDVEAIHLDSSFWLMSGLGLVLTAAVWLSAGLVAAAYDDPRLKDLLQWTSFVIVMCSLGSVPGAILKRALNFRAFAMRTTVATTLGGAVGITMALNGFGVWSLVGLQLVRYGTEAILLIIASKWLPRLRFSFSRCRELFGFGGPILGQNLIAFINNEVPALLIGAFLGPTQVGIYALARRLFDFLSQAFLAPIFVIAMPAASRLKPDPEKVNEFFNICTRLTMFVAFPAFMGLAAIAPVVITFVFGPQWAPSVAIVQLMMVLGLQRAIDAVSSGVLAALGHGVLLFLLALLYASLNIVLISAGAQFGLAAAVLGHVAANYVVLPIFLVCVRKRAGLDIMSPLSILPRLVLATAIMYASVTAWLRLAPETLPDFATLAIAVGLGAVTHAVAAFVLMRPMVLGLRKSFMGLRKEASSASVA